MDPAWEEDRRPAPDESGLPRVEELGLAMRMRKGTALGNMAAALYRMRNVPSGAISSVRAARADGPSRRGPGEAGTEYRAVYLIPAGPGDWEPLRDTLGSVLAHEGPTAKAIVIDDASVSCRAAVVQAEFPQVDVLRRRFPSGGPPRNLPVMLAGIRYALSRYSFDVLIKMDTDALVTGASPSLAAAEFFERQPGIGMAGTYLVRADGGPEDYEWDLWVLRQTEKWSRASRAMMDRARAGGYDGTKVHGGVYALSRRALEALAASGDSGWREPWWTPLGEDFWVSILVLANGFGLGSLGGPGEPFVVASKYTPLSKEEVLAEGKLAIHSVRRGADGEDEATLREFFRNARSEDQAGSASSVATDSRLPPGR